MRVLGLLSLNKSYLLVWSAFQLGKVEVKHTVLHSKNKREGLDFISMTFRSAEKSSRKEKAARAHARQRGRAHRGGRGGRINLYPRLAHEVSQKKSIQRIIIF